MKRADTGSAVTLRIALSPVDAATFAAGTGASRSKGEDAAPADQVPDPSRDLHGKRDRPVVVIDPGHGGIDPGASGFNNVTEKTLVLAVAKRLESALKKLGRFDVKMTRTG